MVRLSHGDGSCWIFIDHMRYVVTYHDCLYANCSCCWSRSLHLLTPTDVDTMGVLAQAPDPVSRSILPVWNSPTSSPVCDTGNVDHTIQSKLAFVIVTIPYLVYRHQSLLAPTQPFDNLVVFIRMIYEQTNNQMVECEQSPSNDSWPNRIILRVSLRWRQLVWCSQYKPAKSVNTHRPPHDHHDRFYGSLSD